MCACRSSLLISLICMYEVINDQFHLNKYISPYSRYIHVKKYL